MSNNPRVLSIGWGIQSFTIAAMDVFGDIEPIDLIIHADTKHESVLTYAFKEKYSSFITSTNTPMVTVHTSIAKTTPVQKGAKAKNAYTYLPLYPKKSNGLPGKLSRYCTANWKITPIMSYLKKYIKKEYGYFKKGALPPDGFVTQLLGISLDEYERMKHNQNTWIQNEYPLIDMRMTREDCKKYLLDHGLEVPPKSACVFCPYRSPETWSHVWDIPEDKAKVLWAEKMVRNFKEDGQEFYLHSSLLDIDELVTRYRNALLDNSDEEYITCDSGHCFV